MRTRSRESLTKHDAAARDLYVAPESRREFFTAIVGAAEGSAGDGKFVEEVKTKLGEKGRPKLKIKPQAFVERVCQALGKKPQEVIGAAKNRERVRTRQILSYVGRTYTDLPVKMLAAVLKVDPTCVSRCVAIVERQLGQDKMLRVEVRRVRNSIYHV